jgi:hypothetical protein
VGHFRPPGLTRLNPNSIRIQSGSATLLRFLDSELEFEVGTELSLPLGLYYGQNKQQLFTRCHLTPYDIQLSDEGQTFTTAVVSAAPGTGGGGCAGLVLSAAKVSHTKVSAELRLPGKAAAVLADKVTVASFQPLKPLSPASGETVLAVDSSRHGMHSITMIPYLVPQTIKLASIVVVVRYLVFVFFSSPFWLGTG